VHLIEDKYASNLNRNRSVRALQSDSVVQDKRRRFTAACLTNPVPIAQELREDEGIARAIGAANRDDGVMWQTYSGIQLRDGPSIPLANLAGINAEQGKLPCCGLKLPHSFSIAAKLELAWVVDSLRQLAWLIPAL
jgi:hypothetical protein